MKYSLVLPDLDKTLISIDDQECLQGSSKAGEHHSWRGNLWLADICNGDSDSTEVSRCKLLVSPKQKDGSRFVATPFGSMRVFMQRGGSEDKAAGGAAAMKSVKSSMPGKVMKILLSVGDLVEKNQPILTIEAMKMENEIRSPIAGIVTEVGVVAGQTVETGQVLFKIEKQK